MVSIEKLWEAFSARPNRYNFLDKGIKIAGFKESPSEGISLLEVGCGNGDTSAYLAERYKFKMVGLDRSPEMIDLTAKRHHASNASFIYGAVEALPFRESTFNGIISEAAFSLLDKKYEAVRMFHRVLMKGGRVLINDFAIRRPTDAGLRKGLIHIPCFRGVDTMENYAAIFADGGFTTISYREEYGEFVSLVVWIAKQLQVPVKMLVQHLSGFHNKQAEATFLKQAQLTYCQMVFEK